MKIIVILYHVVLNIMDITDFFLNVSNSHNDIYDNMVKQLNPSAKNNEH